jgi:hypothetical protein
MYVMYYASMLQCWQLIRILVRTNHPCLRVGHNRYVESRHLQGCSPRLCCLRTDELAPTSKY